MKNSIHALFCLILCVSPLAAAKPAWDLDDVIHTESLQDIQVSPDGRWAVWVQIAPNKERGEAVGNLVRLELATGRETVLTRGIESSFNPRWSPDGQKLAFLRPHSETRDHTTEDTTNNQIWLMDPSGGEPWPLTEWPSSVLHFDWAGPDALVFAAQESPTLRANKLKDEKDDSTVVEDERHEPPVRLFRIEASSKKLTRLTDNGDRIDKLAASPDGRFAVALHQRSLRYNFDNKIKPAVLLHDLHKGQARPIFAEPHWNIQHFYWSPDSRGFYAVNMHNSQPRLAQAGILQLHYFDLARDAETPVDLGSERGLAEQEDGDAPALSVTRDGFIALLADGVHTKIARYTRAGAGWRREWLTGEHADHIFDVQASADGKSLLYAYSTASTPVQWYRAALDGSRLDKPQSFAVLNPGLRQLPRARTEVVTWKGARGDEVQGILYYPHEHRKGAKYPLVVMIHGGPAAADRDAWDDSWASPANLVCQRGAFVLKANYHGSTGYGLKWLESITRGRYGDLETIDIEKGVDSLIARGLVDPARLALSGWSNGAILANLLTVRTTRFQAAVVGAGNVEYVSDWANCEFGDAFNRYYLGASPLENPFLYLLKSPFYRLQRVRTPTLIFFGSDDQTVPVHQGWVQYRALQQLGKADVRFVLFPGEKHSLTKLAHQRRKVKEELAWLDRYLFTSVARSNPSLKDDSPLAWALKRRQAARDSGRYGVRINGRLVPETVTHGELRIGRFEVTRAQFAEFDKTYKIDLGRENYPANGITFEQAKNYCAWLSKQTGRAYRLPSEDEAEELYEHSEGEENTLDHWAGYTVNPDDAARLRETLKKQDTEAFLLKEVGSFRAAGDEAVFDLGGNVAEWVTTKDGKGAVRGGSADVTADSKQKANRSAASYRGVRVVEETGAR